MFRRIIVVSAFVAGFSSFGANASVPRAGDPSPPEARIAAEGLVLVQSGDVEIYYDEFGRRVIVDAYTGEILSVERPRRAEQTPTSQAGAVGAGAGRTLLSRRPGRHGAPPPAAIARTGPRSRPADRRLPGLFARGACPGLDNQFPAAPRRAFPDEPEIIAREPIERAPLDGGQDFEPKPPVAARQPAINEPSINFGAREDVASLQILLDRKGRRQASSTASSAPMSTRRSSPTAPITKENSEIDRRRRHQEGAAPPAAATPVHELHDHPDGRGGALCGLSPGGLRRKGQAPIG